MSAQTQQGKIRGKSRARKTVAIVVLGLSAFLLLGAGAVYRMTMPGALLLMRLEDSSDEALAAGEPLEEEKVTIPSGDRTIPARVYRPATGHDRVILVVHGVHYMGYDEGRLVPFARKLAGLGFAVVTPDIADLRNYDILPRAVDDIERAALWTLDDSGLVPADGDGKVGLLGISFSGGLGLSAASRPALRDRLAFALSFGGHGDLDRTMKYLVTGKLPGGGDLPAHIYGLAVILKNAASAYVPEADVEPLRAALADYLHGDEDAASARLPALGPEARRLLQLVLNRESAKMGEILAPFIESHPCDPSLSPVRQTPPACPVFLLHGTVDNVIPPSESERLGEWAQGSTETHVLLSQLVVHVELEDSDGVTFAEKWDLAVFFTRVLRA